MPIKPLAAAFALVTAPLLTVAAPAFALDATMTRIKATQSINLGNCASSAPFSSAVAGGAPQGDSIDLCKRVAQGIQATLKLLDLKVNRVAVTAKNRFQMVKSGKVDIDSTLARLYRDPAIVALYNTHFGAFGEPSVLLQAMYSLNGLPD